LVTIEYPGRQTGLQSAFQSQDKVVKNQVLIDQSIIEIDLIKLKGPSRLVQIIQVETGAIQFRSQGDSAIPEYLFPDKYIPGQCNIRDQAIVEAVFVSEYRKYWYL
jgi:hypothetical protein